MVENPYSGFYFVLPFFLLGIAFVVLLTTLVPYYDIPKVSTILPTPTDQLIITTPIPTPIDLPVKLYYSPKLGISFEQPINFKIKETNGKIVVTNGLKVIFNTQQPSQMTVDNFNLTISRFKGDLNTVKSEFYLDDNATISRGDQIFLYGWAGVEGTGENHYLLKLENNEWLAFNHHVWLDNDVSLISTKQKGYLDNDSQKLIVDRILSSLKITKVENQLGFIKKTYTINSKNYIDIDYIQMLSDNSAPNGYLIKNDNPLIRTLELKPDALISIVNMDSLVNHSPVNFATFKVNLDNPDNPNTAFPYDITIENNLVTKMTARYLP